MKAAPGGRARQIAPIEELAGRAGDERVMRYLPLVRFVAEKIHRRLPPGVDLESLVHSGVVGLLEALNRFDPGRGVEFETYARYRIRGEVMQCLRSLDWVSRSVRAWGRRIEGARAALAARLGREPTSEEMAQELAIPLETYFRVDQQVADASLLSIEALSVAGETDWERLEEAYASADACDPLRFIEGKDLVEKLSLAVEALPDRERLVVTLYYHEELTLREIGEILSLSEGRICQIFAQAVGRLRNALGVTPGGNGRRSGRNGARGAPSAEENEARGREPKSRAAEGRQRGRPRAR
ncbi:MAG TPA: FliA/WhiG family RNA polymerase sigma factor [candidate division Zixibacteria bacterium]|nr:FliA/WhiG family RNA polymerase sigma factor [candidate division Zixibacteria bacterium]